MSGAHDLDVVDGPSEADVAAVDGGLERFNATAGSILRTRVLGIFSREGDRVVGGLLARTSGTQCEVQVLWVEEARRGEGLGRALMAAAEEEARRRGCVYLFLDTLSFQAPDFYASLGYDELYRHGPFDGGVEKIHMGKAL